MSTRAKSPLCCGLMFQVNCTFIFFVIHGIREKQLPYRNYVLLLNRSVVDLIIAAFTTFFVALKKFETMQYVMNNDNEMPTHQVPNRDRNCSYWWNNATTPSALFTLSHDCDDDTQTMAYSNVSTTAFAVPDAPLSNTTVYTTKIEYIIPHGRTLFTLMLTINFWSVAGSYAVLALFTYMAVRLGAIMSFANTWLHCYLI